MSSPASIPWYSDILGVAYRFFDLRMNIVPLFSDRKTAVKIWMDNIRPWVDPSIKLRFVEVGDDYWFVMGSETKKPEKNISFFKVLPKSENYERFKKGHDGEAYLRLGTYTRKSIKDVKDDAICDCGHYKEDHDDSENNDECLYEDCACKKFDTFQVNLLKKKKVITDIKFLKEEDVKDDPLAWNCLYLHKYKENE